jgi:polysaccharide pyruvyl transferase CsaB
VELFKKPRLVLSGYYGADNAGDEAILVSILQLLEREGYESIVLSQNPAKTTSLYGVEAVGRKDVGAVIKAIKNSDGLISGGGSLIQDVTSIRNSVYYLGVMNIALLFRKPVFVYSQGIGPINNRFLHSFIDWTLNRAEYVSVRDENSKKLLKKIGLSKSIVVSVDPVLGIDTTTITPIQNPTLKSFLSDKPIVLSLRPWKKDSNQTIRNIVQVVNGLTAKNIPVLFLPFHYPNDLEVAEKVKQLCANKEKLYIVKEELGIFEFLEIIKRSRLVIGMRLHALVFAASQSIPFVGITYDPKIEAFMKLYNLKPATTSDEWDVSSVLTNTFDLLKESDSNSPFLRERLSELKKKTTLPIDYITQYFEEDLDDGSIRY